jgi:hypothetical protein
MWGILLAAAIVFVCRVFALGVNVILPVQLLVYLAALFTGCMVCHGELFRSRPDPRHLTAFYLTIAAGGALGGVFVALVAPALFRGFWEYPIAWWLTVLAVIVAWYRGGFMASAPRWLPPLIWAGIFMFIVVTVRPLVTYSSQTETVTRNFYGVLRVIRHADGGSERRSLIHGAVTHGFQFTDQSRRRLPTSYYGLDSGVGLSLGLHPKRLAGQRLRVGVVGLGTGTIAAYGRKGDSFRFYEINPSVIAIAQSRFTFLKDSAAQVDIVTGDARIMLEEELTAGKPQQFDILVIDAFSSDSIPIHLLTRECFTLYGRHLSPDGLLAVHITNRFLDLSPIVRRQGQSGGYETVLIASQADEAGGCFKSDWMILTRSSAFLDNDRLRKRLSSLPAPAPRPWTDDYASLWPLLKH